MNGPTRAQRAILDDLDREVEAAVVKARLRLREESERRALRARTLALPPCEPERIARAVGGWDTWREANIPGGE